MVPLHPRGQGRGAAMPRAGQMGLSPPTPHPAQAQRVNSPLLCHFLLSTGSASTLDGEGFFTRPPTRGLRLPAAPTDAPRDEVWPALGVSRGQARGHANSTARGFPFGVMKMFQNQTVGLAVHRGECIRRP